MVNVVTVNVEQQVAPAPNQLQRTGFLISQGGTNTSPGTQTLLTQLSDLTPYLSVAKALSGLVWSSGGGGTATATTAAPHGFTLGDTLEVTIAGSIASVTPGGFNGTFLATVTGASTFTYPLAADPGTETTPGTYVVANAAELDSMAMTFFAQGSSVPVYVFECGPGNPNDGIAFLSSWLTANPGVVYSILVPREWDANSNYLDLLAEYDGDTAKLYFFTTTTLATYAAYSTSLKDAPLLIEAPAYGVWPANVLLAISWSGGQVTATTTSDHGVAVGEWFQIAGVTPTGYNGYWQAQAGTAGTTLIYNVPATLGSGSGGTLVASYYASTGIPSTEFSMAAPFWVTLSANPSNANKVPPLNLSYLSDVTPWSIMGNSALLATLAAANVWTVQTGAAGDISNTLLVGGNMPDGNPWNYWYTADWAQINVTVNITAAVINGSNNLANPLYYDQDGINRLEAVGAATLDSGVTFGLILGQVIETQLDGTTFGQNLANGLYDGNAVINAVPFVAYLTSSPGDYKIGRYAGFTCVITPLRGFDQIVFTLIITNFPVP